MRTYDNLAGQRFGFLTAVQYYPREIAGTNAHWICRCDCGNYLVVRADNLKSGHSRKCSHCVGGRGGKRSVFIEGVIEDGVV